MAMRTPRDYANGKIYIMESLEGKIYYIGSTCCDLRKRMANHKSRHMAVINGKANYTTASEVMDWPDVRISLVEDFPCDRKEQLDAREAHFIRNGSPAFAQDSRCVNRYIPGRSGAEYYRDHKEEMIAKSRAYKAANKEELAVKAKAYKQAHREEIRAAVSAPRRCDLCDCIFRHSYMSEHLRTKKHKERQAELDALPDASPDASP